MTSAKLATIYLNPIFFSLRKALIVSYNAILKNRYKYRFILRRHIRNILNNAPQYKYRYINQALTREYTFMREVVDQNKQLFIECLGCINRYYVAIVRFQRMFRLQRMKVFDIQETLECEPMESIPENE